MHAGISINDCCVLNRGNGAWAFEPLAQQLAASIGIDVSSEPRLFNYLLHWEEDLDLSNCGSFVPEHAIRAASDKRLLADLFKVHSVRTPETHLVHSFPEVLAFPSNHPDRAWCLKFPTSCGASGHTLLDEHFTEPMNWPRPFIVQEFIRMDSPQVFRTYCAAGELFGWVVRRFPEGGPVSPWVAHARGARYVNLGKAPSDASNTGRLALLAAGLLDSFGCVDLLQRPSGEWVVLEVGTDGLFNHVDREIGDTSLEAELNRRIAESFWIAARKQ